MTEELAQTTARDRVRSRRRTFRAVRRPAILGALLLVLLVAGSAGGMWLRQRLTHVEENDAQTAGEVTTIASRLDGWLITRPAMEGDHVKKGQVLGELDTRDAQLRLAALEGNLAAHDAQIRETTIEHDTTQQTSEAQIADAQAELASAEAAVAVAAPQADTARADLGRADPLIGTGDISRQNWDHAHATMLQQTAALRQAQAQLAARRAALAQAIAGRGQVSMLEQQLAVLHGERDALAAQADQVRQEIADRTLRAPFDGIVDRTFIHAGDYVQAGQWLMMLHDPDNVWVEANVKETEVGRLRVGQPANVVVDAYPDIALHGRVLRVGNAATNQFALLPSPNPSGNFTKITQRVPIRIAIDKPRHPLQPGLMVEVSIDVAD
ncbi:HlyD family secretion protein [Telmatospirillum sp.]|uniref:HlyD family secretion protein n=1 Tax=Telmatospirillum sp. TaxID=2079197 RepID=UPI00283E504A|nr:HlyD family secretion protein [Telmatospirillum sp.]MDR3438802.1 HlyD family secretion protein [Telmatospirillum sp.]